MKSRKALTLFDDYHAMMSDPIRLDAFRQAIHDTVRPGDIVLDLGSGLGILSFLALRAGAARVIAIEKNDAIELARQVARDNGLEDRIEFVNQNSKDYEPTSLADVLVSETLGSFGVEENTLDFMIDARNRLLKPGGRMVPRFLRLQLAPVQHDQGRKRADFWQDVHGFDFSVARTQSLSRMSVATIAPTQLLAEPLQYADIAFETIRSSVLSHTMVFPIRRAGRIDGLAGWFGAGLTDRVGIWTSPLHPPTHWKQAFFPFREPTKVIAGDFLEVTLRVDPKASNADDSVISYDYRCTQTGLAE